MVVLFLFERKLRESESGMKWTKGGIKMYNGNVTKENILSTEEKEEVHIYG